MPLVMLQELIHSHWEHRAVVLLVSGHTGPQQKLSWLVRSLICQTRARTRDGVCIWNNALEITEEGQGLPLPAQAAGHKQQGVGGC